MAFKHVERMLQLKKLAAELEKIAQQLRLPGVQEPQFDLPGVPLDMPSKIEKDRHDLSALDLSNLKHNFHSDVKKIINHELKANPNVSKDDIIDLVMSRAKEEPDELISEYLKKVPSLRANIPTPSNQMTLPGAPPEINIFPTKKDIEEGKQRIQEDTDAENVETQKKIEEYDAKKKVVIEKYKAEHEGNEPHEYELRRLMDYQQDPRDKDRRSVRPEDVKLDLEQISQGQYKTYLHKLYAMYYEVENNYNTLDALYEQLGDIKDPAELPMPDPNQFGSYAEMIHDLQARVIAGIQSVVKNSVGYSLFGIATSGTRRRWNRETDIFNQQEDEWFADPGKMKAFLQAVPKVYDNKDNFWRSWGLDANDISYWFQKKYKSMADYNDSLKRAKASFGKGLRFYKSIDKKLAENVKGFLDTSAFKYSTYIETTPEHRAKLNELYLEIVTRINETSRVIGRQGNYYNNGLYDANSYREPSVQEVDIGAMLSSKVPQYKMIESMSKLLVSSIFRVAKQINENELGPFVKELAQEMATSYIKEKLGLEESDLAMRVTTDDNRGITSKTPVYGDPRAIKVADAWLQYASSSKLATNFQSLIKYPEFIFKGEQDNSKFLIEAMKEKLGYLVTKLLEDKLALSFSDRIRMIVNEPTFNYQGPNELRKTVVAQKEELYAEIQRRLDTAAQNGLFELTIPQNTSMADEATMPRYAKLKGVLVAAIGEIPSSDSRFFNQLANRIPGYYYRAEKNDAKELLAANADKIANQLIYESSTGNGRAYYDDSGHRGSKFMDALLKYDALLPLQRNIKKRQAEVIDSALVNKGYFVPMVVQEKMSNLYAKDLNTPEQIESLKELALPLDFSNADFDRPFLSLIASMAGKSIEEVEEALPGIIAKQTELNKQFNESLPLAIEKLKYLHATEKKMSIEMTISRVFSHRLQTFGGVGPHAIGAKFQEITKTEAFQHLPLGEMARIANDKTISDIKANDYQMDDTIHLYKQFADDDKKGTTLGVAISTIAKTLGIKEPNQLLKLYHTLEASFKEKNIAREDIEYIFPAMITSLEALPSQLEAAEALAKFAHSDGEGLSKETILSFAKNPNFKDWIKEVDAIENFFDIYITIKRKGGARKIMTESKPVIDALLKTKAIKPGFMKRLQLITQAFENGTRINPSIEGFESIRKLINQTAYDLEAVESYATFAEYNAQITEKKLFKDPQLAKLNWNMPDKKFRFRVLDTYDPYHFQVGVDTDCCQKLGGAGEAAAIDSYINPIAGVVLLEAVVEGEYKTVAQSYFHYVPTDNGIILDNVETSDHEEQLKEITGYDIDTLYAWWANVKKDQRKYKYFLCGTSYNKLSNESYSKEELKSDPRSFQHTSKYSDFNYRKSINLYRPAFELPEEAQVKKKKKQKRTEASFDLFPLLAFS